MPTIICIDHGDKQQRVHFNKKCPFYKTTLPLGHECLTCHELTLQDARTDLKKKPKQSRKRGESA